MPTEFWKKIGIVDGDMSRDRNETFLWEIIDSLGEPDSLILELLQLAESGRRYGNLVGSFTVSPLHISRVITHLPVQHLSVAWISFMEILKITTNIEGCETKSVHQVLDNIHPSYYAFQGLWSHPTKLVVDSLSTRTWYQFDDYNVNSRVMDAPINILRILSPFIDCGLHCILPKSLVKIKGRVYQPQEVSTNFDPLSIRQWERNTFNLLDVGTTIVTKELEGVCVIFKDLVECNKILALEYHDGKLRPCANTDHLNTWFELPNCLIFHHTNTMEEFELVFLFGDRGIMFLLMREDRSRKGVTSDVNANISNLEDKVLFRGGSIVMNLMGTRNVNLTISNLEDKVRFQGGSIVMNPTDHLLTRAQVANWEQKKQILHDPQYLHVFLTP